MALFTKKSDISDQGGKLELKLVWPIPPTNCAIHAEYSEMSLSQKKSEVRVSWRVRSYLYFFEMCISTLTLYHKKRY